MKSIYTLLLFSILLLSNQIVLSQVQGQQRIDSLLNELPKMNEAGKKYASRHFLSLLESIADKPLSEQQQLLEQELTKHQGDRNQIDDITIIGVKL